jgi:hypothetical protein
LLAAFLNFFSALRVCNRPFAHEVVIMLIRRILCAFAVGLVASIAFAQQAPRKGLDPSALTHAEISAAKTPASLSRLAAIYKERGDLERLEWTLERLSELLPASGDVKLGLAKTYALRDEKSKAYDLLLKLQKQGYGYDLSKDADFAKVTGTKVWPYILGELGRNAAPSGEGKVAFSLPAGDHLYESLAFDPKRGQLLVGSVRDGSIQLVGKDGSLSPFIAADASNGLWSVYAMAAAPDEDALYVASTASVYFRKFDQADFGKAGVFKFQLSNGKLLGKYLLTPDAKPRTLSSIAVGKGGLAFAADGLRNVIYRLDGAALKPVVANPRLTSLRGLAVSGDGKNLYFADYALGVFGVDLTAGTAFDLIHDASKVPLAGIDGLYWYDNALVAIQNGMVPRRVLRLHLDDSGRAVVRAVVIDSGNSEFSLPSYGTIDGDHLEFIANSQKNGYDAYGNPIDVSRLAPVKVFRSNLRYSWDTGGVAMPRPHRVVVSESKPGSGRFTNVEGGSQSVTGN